MFTLGLIPSQLLRQFGDRPNGLRHDAQHTECNKERMYLGAPNLKAAPD